MVFNVRMQTKNKNGINMKSGTSLIVLFLTIVLSGCAAQKPATYDHSKSRALNLANAAGIWSSLRDRKVPKDTVNTLMNSDAADLAFAVSAFDTPMPGLSGLQSFGFSLLASSLGPEDPASRNSIFAWMPYNSSHNPELSFLKIMEKSVEKTITDLGMKFWKDPRYDKNVVVYLISGKFNCPDESENKPEHEFCIFSYNIGDQDDALAPSYIMKNRNQKTHFFSSRKSYHSDFYFSQNGKVSKIPQYDFLKKLSHNMPP